MDTTVAEWITDFRCHNALSCSPLHCSADTIISLLMDASSSFLFNKSIMENANLLLESQLSSSSCVKVCKRVLLVDLAMRCCIGLEHDLTFAADNFSPLKSALELSSKLEELFSSSFEDLFSTFHALTLEKLLFIVAKHNGTFVATDEFNNYKSFLSLEKQQTLKQMLSGNFKDTSLDFGQYIYHVFIFLNALNDSLDEPFLLKLEKRLQSKSEHLPAGIPQTTVEELQQLISAAQSHFINIDSNVTDDLKSPYGSILKDSNSLAHVSECGSNSDKKNASSSQPCCSKNVNASLSMHRQTRPKIQKNIVHVNKSIRRKWNDEEDAHIIKAVTMNGPHWADISRTYPFTDGRSGGQIKDRWRTLVKQNVVKLDSLGKIVKVDPRYMNLL